MPRNTAYLKWSYPEKVREALIDLGKSVEKTVSSETEPETESEEVVSIDAARA